MGGVGISRLSPEIYARRRTLGGVVAIGLMFAVQVLWLAALAYAAYRVI